MEDGELSSGLADENPLGSFWVGLPPLAPFSLAALILDCARFISLSTLADLYPSGVSIRYSFMTAIHAVLPAGFRPLIRLMRSACANEGIAFSVE